LAPSTRFHSFQSMFICLCTRPDSCILLYDPSSLPLLKCQKWCHSWHVRMSG
jgi:hypothetical protein